jgi:hypothetical protein
MAINKLFNLLITILPHYLKFNCMDISTEAPQKNQDLHFGLLLL